MGVLYYKYWWGLKNPSCPSIFRPFIGAPFHPIYTWSVRPHLGKGQKGGSFVSETMRSGEVQWLMTGCRCALCWSRLCSQHLQDSKWAMKKTGPRVYDENYTAPGILGDFFHKLGVGFKYLYFHPEPWIDDPMWRLHIFQIFQMGWFNQLHHGESRWRNSQVRWLSKETR